MKKKCQQQYWKRSTSIYWVQEVPERLNQNFYFCKIHFKDVSQRRLVHQHFSSPIQASKPMMIRATPGHHQRIGSFLTLQTQWNSFAWAGFTTQGTLTNSRAFKYLLVFIDACASGVGDLEAFSASDFSTLLLSGNIHACVTNRETGTAPEVTIWSRPSLVIEATNHISLSIHRPLGRTSSWKFSGPCVGEMSKNQAKCPSWSQHRVLTSTDGKRICLKFDTLKRRSLWMQGAGFY